MDTLITDLGDKGCGACMPVGPADGEMSSYVCCACRCIRGCM